MKTGQKSVLPESIKFCNFDMDQSIVAPVIYRNYSHMTTSKGVEIGTCIVGELSRLLTEFLKFHNRTERGTFIRVDAFLSEHGLNIIEFNVEVADGWGVALNLARACGRPVCLPVGTELPGEYIARSADYLPEYELAKREFSLIGHDSIRIIETFHTREIKDTLDNKLCLERFSRTWISDTVRIPKLYSVETTRWEDVPDRVVFKFVEKYGYEALRARYSVIPREDIGKGKHVRRSYNASRAIAQDRITPHTLDSGAVTQVIIMCSGSTPITGYLQVAPKGEFIINDRTACKGPLLFV